MSIYTPTAKICIDISAVNFQVQRADTDYSLSNQSPTLTSQPPLFKFNMLTPIQAQHAATDTYKISALNQRLQKSFKSKKDRSPG